MRRALALALICLGLVLTGPARAQDDAGALAELLQDLLSDQGRSVRIEGFEGAYAQAGQDLERAMAAIIRRHEEGRR
ncbi:MAG: hypothetical protein ACO3FX_08460 [Gemmobacter sp.]